MNIFIATARADYHITSNVVRYRSFGLGFNSTLVDNHLYSSYLGSQLVKACTVCVFDLAGERSAMSLEYITDAERNAIQIPYSPEVVAEVQKIINDQLINKSAPMTAWWDVIEILNREKNPYEWDLNVDQTLTHPKNRNYAMLNPYNCQRVVKLVKRSGASKAELKKACAIEICPIPSIRAKQIESNEKLIKTANGLLASINGTERVLTISTGHTAAGFKAVRAGCKCIVPELGDKATGRLNQQIACGNDAIMHGMCDKGWKFLILPWQVEIAWPMLPNLGQHAYNAANGTPGVSSELEAAQTIDEYRTSQLAMGAPYDKQLCIDTALSNNPICSEYMDVVADFADTLGGGPGVPVIVFLDKFAKRYGENLRLGREFLVSVTYVKLDKDGIEGFPYIRIGCVATNLVSTKIVDSIAKTIVKSDVERLKHKDVRKTLVEAELMLKTAWKLTNKLEGEVDLTDQLGRLLCRTTLFICTKQKLSNETATFEDISEIRSAFATESHKAYDKFSHEAFPLPVEAPEISEPADAAAPGDPPAPVTPANQAAELDANSDPIVIAAGMGIVEGVPIYERSVGPAKGLYIVKSVTAEVVNADGWNFGLHSSKTITFPVQNLKDWTVYKAALPVALRVEPETYSPCNARVMTTESAKTLIFNYLFNHVNAHHPTNLIFTMNPSGVMVATDVKKGELRLTPITDVAKISANASTSIAVAKVDGKPYYLSECARPRVVTVAEWPKDVMLAPFWWVSPVEKESDANMFIIGETDTATKVSIPIFVNKSALASETRLTYYKPKKAVAPLANATAVVTPKVAAPKAKRARVG